jgi:hypothetical protein
MSCPRSRECPFHIAVEASVAKRIRFASSYPYCRGGKHAECAISLSIERGEAPPADLLPTGGHAVYSDEAAAVVVEGDGSRVLVVDDSPVFCTISKNVIGNMMPESTVVACVDYGEARRQLDAGPVALVVSGLGIGDGRTAHDLRPLTEAPIIVLSGRPDADLGGLRNARLVRKDAGPGALSAAIEASLA